MSNFCSFSIFCSQNSHQGGESYRILEEPNERNEDVRTYLSEYYSSSTPTISSLSWIHALRELDYRASSAQLQQEALQYDTNVTTKETLWSIAKLMSLQVLLEEDNEEKNEAASSSINVSIRASIASMNAHLKLIFLQKNYIVYHSIKNKSEHGAKYKHDQLLTLEETLECHFNRLEQLTTNPMSEWNHHVRSKAMNRQQYVVNMYFVTHLLLLLLLLLFLKFFSFCNSSGT